MVKVLKVYKSICTIHRNKHIFTLQHLYMHVWIQRGVGVKEEISGSAHDMYVCALVQCLQNLPESIYTVLYLYIYYIGSMVIQACIHRLLIMIQISNPNTVHRVTYTSFKIIMLN